MNSALTSAIKSPAESSTSDNVIHRQHRPQHVFQKGLDGGLGAGVGVGRRAAKGVGVGEGCGVHPASHRENLQPETSVTLGCFLPCIGRRLQAQEVRLVGCLAARHATSVQSTTSRILGSSFLGEEFDRL